jgi:hypothetical protein
MAAFTAIDDAGAFFNIKLFTGDGVSQSFTDIGFDPDLVWDKARDAGEDWQVTDSVRGATKGIRCNENYAQDTIAESLTAFQTGGYTLGSSNYWNYSTKLMANWCWKAGTTTGIDTTSTDITPSAYSFNQDTGFSVIKYTGNGLENQKLAHGLGAVPGMAFFKNLDATESWYVYHKNMDATAPEDYYMVLNTATAKVNSNGAWYDTAPDSVNITLGNNAPVNGSGTPDYIAYFFTGKQGYSSFGTFTGNANADGPFIYTGFRPALIILKDTVAAQNWLLWDDKRLGYNPDNNPLLPSQASVAETNNEIDILSNGFKMRSATYNAANIQIYAAFAQSPFVNSNGVPTNAR